MRTINHSNYEEWIFEYYEGTLNTDEKALVLEFVQKDTIYKDEFENYAKTYLHEPLPAKLSIEDSLIRREGLINIRYVISTLVILIASGIFLINPADKSIIEDKVDSIKTILNEKRSDAPLNIPVLSSLGKLKHRRSLVKEDIIKTDSNHASFNLTPGLEIHSLNAQIKRDTLNPKELIVVGVKTQAAEVVKSKKEMTRQERKEYKRKARSLEAFKEKQRRRKNAEKLMNGDKPYVVPLDPNIF